jgi:hypothetical protein
MMQCIPYVLFLRPSSSAITITLTFALAVRITLADVLVLAGVRYRPVSYFY